MQASPNWSSSLHKMKTNLICLLSDDMLLKLFSFLTRKDLRSVSKVCTKWCRVSKDSYLWFSLNLHPYRHTIDEQKILLEILQTYFTPLGRKLSLRGMEVNHDVLYLLFSKCHHLHTVDLRDCKFHFWNGVDYECDFKSLKRVDMRGALGVSLMMQSVLQQAVGLECLGMYRLCMKPGLTRPQLFSNKPLLRTLDCSQCDWLTDDIVQIIADHCPLLEYISLYRCFNYIGYSLKDLIHNCRNLKTLILTGTRLNDHCIGRADWTQTSVTSLDLLHCAFITYVGVSMILLKIPHLRYLRCVMAEEDFRVLRHFGYPEVETLQIHRRFPINIDNASEFLVTCPKVTCLDISLIPFSHVHFKAFLPKMPHLKWICFAANEMTGTNLIVKTLTCFNKYLESVWVVYYHCNERQDIIEAFKELANNCKSLKTVNLTGLYVSEVVKELEIDVQCATGRTDIEFVENQKFRLPQPEHNLDSYMEF